MDLLDLVVRLSADISNFQQGMSNAQQTANNTATGMASALNNANIGEALQGISEKANALADGIANAFISAATTVGQYTANIIQQSTSLYGNYQQLVGGVETLFGEDYQTVLKNADDAFMNMGISANNYMETATSFAAALVSSLDGDTQKASASVDLALQDMSDNANKMGTDMNSIQRAYQGFAKQNYTMLDNLKLGYGGTKTEMERLLADAEKLTGVKYDISNFDDIINAIHAIQTEIGITGTTADEAKGTIQGSAAAMQAAWENLLTAMADPERNHDLGQMVQDFVDTAITSIDNMMPSIEAALLGIGDVVEQLAPVVEEKLSPLLDKIMPPVIKAVSTLTTVILTAITDNMPLIISTVLDAIQTIWDNIDGQAKSIITIIGVAWASIKGIGIAADILKLIELLGGASGLQAALTSISTFLTSTLSAAATSVTTAFGTAFSTLQAQVTAFGTQAVAILNGTASAATIAAAEIAVAAVAIGAIIKVADELNTIASAMNAQTENEEKAEETIQHFQDTLKELDEMPVSVEKYEKLGQTLDEIKQAREDWARVYQETNSRIVELESKTFKTAEETAELKRLQQERDSLDAEYANLVLYQTKVENGLAEYSDELIAEIRREEQAEKAALDNKNAMYAGYYADADNIRQKNIENAKKTSTGNLGLDNVLQEHLDALEHDLKVHKITEEEYWAEKKRYVEMFRNEESETWNAYYDEVIAHYDQATKTEQREAEKAQRDRENALKNHFRDLESMMYENGYTEEWLVQQERAYIEALDHNSELYKEYNNKLLKDEKRVAETAETERVRQEAEREKQLKDDLLEQFRIFEQTKLDNNLSEEWLLNQERMYIETLDHESELYKEYNLTLTKKETELADKIIEERKKKAEEIKKSFTSAIDEVIKDSKKKIEEYQKAVDDIKKKIETFADKLTDSFGSMFEFTKDENTGKVSATKTQDFFTTRIRMLEEYYENIKKLKEKGISDAMLKELSSLSAEEGAAAAEYLLKMSDSELQRLGRIYTRYENTAEMVSGELYADDMEAATQELDSEKKRNETLEKMKESIDEKLSKILETLLGIDFGELSSAGDIFTDFSAKMDSGFAVNIDGKQLVGAILPIINSSLGSATRASMRGST